jgi:hypothetical protein
MENFKAITQSSIDKCKSIGINADQLDVLVSEFKLDHNLVSDLLHRASNLEVRNITIPPAQLAIVKRAINNYQLSLDYDGVEYDHYDCHALGQLLSGDYKVTVELTDDNLTFCSKSGVDIPMYIDDDPTNFCSNSTCRKAIYDHSEYCDDSCRTSNI